MRTTARHRASIRGLGVLIATCVAIIPGMALPSSADAPVSGAIFTTESTCTGVNLNIYANKDDVYIDGGPAHIGAAGLPDGSYYVRVTEPDGTLLGTSGNATPAIVSGGEFSGCLQLSAILVKASDGTAGYDDTSNSGGEYKVWVSNVSTFDNNSTKTDNFKVLGDAPCTPGIDPGCSPQEQAPHITVEKFYDANANGLYDSGETLVNGWKVHIEDSIDYIRFTPVDVIVAPDNYTVTEYVPVESNWYVTTSNPVTFSLAVGATHDVKFGNVCVGSGGGLTLGFWSNKNGQAAMNDGGSAAPELALLSALNLRNANGSNFDTTVYSQFRTWILNATATNMAYMLSAQLAAMELNVEAGNVKGSALIYAPGATNANSLGFASVADVMTEANTSLGTDGYTVASGPVRTYQEALKNALDRANNNLNFVQGSACAFSFAS